MEIPYLSLKHITAMHGEEIRQAVEEVVGGGWYLQGERVRRFEEEYAAYMGQEYCISCGNGFDALTLMLRTYKDLGVLNTGDEVLVPANTFIATMLSITENGLTPILIEPRLSTFQINDDFIESTLTPRTKAIMIVHLYGYNALTEKLISLCKKHNLLLLQDCAQAQGLNKVCSLPDDTVRGAKAHSFYPAKNLGALADAGAITTNDAVLAEAVRAIANYGMEEKYVCKYKGRNSRMDEINAAVLSVKLKYLDEDNLHRREIAKQYVNNIRSENIVLPPLSGVHHVFPILSQERDRLKGYLQEHGIETLIHYPIPPHKQECYKEWNNLSLPITERIHKEELSLPCNQAMSFEEVNYIISTIKNFSD